jgi:hypothetical protein
MLFSPDGIKSKQDTAAADLSILYEANDWDDLSGGGRVLA